MRKSLVIICIVLVALFFILLPKNIITNTASIVVVKPTRAPSPTPTPTLLPLPMSKVIPMQKHMFQSFNNCGPATLAMALSYYSIDKSQEALGQILRPYQIPNGDNDDKSVTLAEVAEHAKIYGLIPYLRPNGTIEKIKQLISLDMPVVTRTQLKENEDIGHYRIIRGFDDTTQELIQDDSLQSANSRYDYDSFLTLWKSFNYEYLVLVPREKQDIVEAILSDERNEKTAWQNSLERIQKELEQDPDNVDLLFNLSLNYYHLENFEEAVQAFEKVENQLTFRRLWYQIEPILAYHTLKQYDRVFELTDKILNNHNRAFSELYFIRGQIYQEQGETELAKQEYEKAIYYKTNYTLAKSALELLNS